MLVTSLGSCDGRLGSTEVGLHEVLDPLRELAEEARLLEARLPGGLPYAPCPETEVDGRLAVDCSAVAWSHPEVAEAMRRLENRISEASRSSTPVGRHAEAIRDLLWARDLADIDRVLDELEDLSVTPPATGALDITRTAALIRRFDLGSEALDLLAALDSANRALRVEASAEALFNRNLVLERLFLSSQAEAGWRQYGELYPTDGWRREADTRRGFLKRREESGRARRHDLPESGAGSPPLDQLEALPYRPEAVRDLVEETLLPTWVRALRSGDRETAERVLGFLESLATRHVEETGDRFAEATSAVLRTATEGSPLIEAHLLYGQARARYREQRIAEAEALFARAADLFANSDSPFLGAAWRYLANCAYLDRDYLTVIEFAERALRFARRRDFHELAGKAGWLLGTVELERTHLGRAVYRFEGALADLRRVRSPAHQSAVSSNLAVAYSFLGDTDRAWSYRYRALSLAAQAGDFERRPVVFSEAARAASHSGWSAGALALQREVLHLELASGDPLAITEAYWWRGSIFREAGRWDEAFADVETAMEWCDEIHDPSTRRHTRAGLLTLQGELLATRDPTESLRLLATALEAYQDTGTLLSIANLHSTRARTLFDLGRFTEAEGELVLAIERFENQADNSGNWLDRVRLFDQATELFEMMTRLQLEQHRDPWRAWTYTERGKARWMLEQISGDDTPWLHSWDALQSSLPEDTVLLEFSVIQDQIVFWRISRDTMEHGVLPLDRRALTMEIEEFRHALLRDEGVDDEWVARSQRLFELLLRPTELPEASHLVLVPDEAMFRLPFDALIDPATDQFLVEEYELTTAPSTAVFLATSRRLRGRPPLDDATVLAVGDPAFDRASNPRLRPLPSAAEEARKVFSLFPDSELMLSSAATIPAFLAALDRHRIVHFAGHAVLHHDNPLFSKLLLAPDTSNDTGELFARDLYELRLHNVELVILSACETGVGPTSSLEGSLNLAHPLLAAGVPTVGVTLWRVEDRRSRLFMDQFFARLRQSGDPSRALRQTKIAFLESQNPSLRAPKHWAAFQWVGAQRPRTP